MDKHSFPNGKRLVRDTLKPDDNLHYEKFSDGTVKCIEDEIPFDVPDNWEWVRIKTACVINPRNSIDDNTEVSFVPMANIKEGYANKFISDIRVWKKVKKGYTHFADNDIGIAKITPCFENKKSVVFSGLINGYGAGTTELYIVRTISSLVIPEFLLNFVKRDDFIAGGVLTFSGDVGQQRVTKDYVANYLFTLPPLNEQQRILNAVHNANSLIESIEKSKDNLIRDIDKTKSKILDLAIRGKLVPQDPNDEPASVLLERIRTEKEELIKQDKIKRDKKESVIFKGDDNSYYEKYGEKLPSGWVVTNFETLLSYEQPTNYIVKDTNYNSEYETPVLTAGKSFILGYTDEKENIFSELPVIIFDDFTTETKFVDFPFKVKSSAMKILHINTDLVLPKFAFYLMQATQIDHDNHQRYWISIYSQEEIALPPLKEQERILSALEQYFKLLNCLL